jgi:NAD(P)-dependent dehydrogenase (short-subunit alcohol dehydrogenase family)
MLHTITFLSLIDRGIFVNAVASGPVRTDSIVSTLEPGKVAQFGVDTAWRRGNVPDEITRCYLLLARADSSYLSGQVLHPNGEVSNG